MEASWWRTLPLGEHGDGKTECNSLDRCMGKSGWDGWMWIRLTSLLLLPGVRDVRLIKVHPNGEKTETRAASRLKPLQIISNPYGESSRTVNQEAQASHSKRSFYSLIPVSQSVSHCIPYSLVWQSQNCLSVHLRSQTSHSSCLTPLPPVKMAGVIGCVNAHIKSLHPHFFSNAEGREGWRCKGVRILVGSTSLCTTFINSISVVRPTEKKATQQQNLFV